MTYSDAIRYLYELRLFGLKLGLDSTRHLAGCLGNPDRQLRFIHVAGTNGKGSTCAILDAIYRSARLRVGLFTSPHLVHFSERIQVNRQPIPHDDVVRLVQRIQSILKQFPTDHHPTFFEVVTAIALQYFAEQQCDLVVWETGMGGRLDATNIVTPLASIITNVQFDHQQWLGSTLTRIATEKAGIIKPHVPILTATEEPDALQVIIRTAQNLSAPLTHVTRTDLHSGPNAPSLLSLPGQHQKLNAALALATAHALHHIIPVPQTRLQSALQQVHWPGRLQLVSQPNGQQLLLDGAHNLAGAQSLKTALTDLFPAIQPTLIFGILNDKDWMHIAGVLAPLSQHILCVPIRSERTASPDILARACRQANPSAQVHAHPSLSSALQSAHNHPFLLVTGSLYLIGETLEQLHLSPVNGRSEVHLNEYVSQP